MTTNETAQSVGSPYNMSDKDAATWLRANARRITGVFILHDKPAAGFPWFPLGHVQHVKFIEYLDSHPLPASQTAMEDYYLKYADSLDPQQKQA